MKNFTVESYAGARAEEFPLRIFLNDRKIEILAIKKRWLVPGRRYFRVLGKDKIIYVLEYIEADDTWNLVELNRQSDSS